MIKNAKITGTFLGYGDHGILTYYISLDYGDSFQSFGGYALDRYDKEQERRVGSAIGMDHIASILSVLEVDSWEKLEGEYIRVEAVSNTVMKIGHVIKDEWFNPEDYFKNDV